MPMRVGTVRAIPLRKLFIVILGLAGTLLCLATCPYTGWWLLPALGVTLGSGAGWLPRRYQGGALVGLISGALLAGLGLGRPLWGLGVALTAGSGYLYGVALCTD